MYTLASRRPCVLGDTCPAAWVKTPGNDDDDEHHHRRLGHLSQILIPSGC